MTPSALAKKLGAKSLTQVSEYTGYTLDTLRKYYKEKPNRFKALCAGTVCAMNNTSLQFEGNYLRVLRTLPYSEQDS